MDVNKEREVKIRSAQRRMLRWILGSGRRPVVATKLESGNSNSSNSSGSNSSDSGSVSEPEAELEQEEADMSHEAWLDWVKRTTQFVEEQLIKTGLEDWVRAIRRRIWRWAGHTARRTDGRWSTTLLNWIPSGGFRNQGRPCKRWDDDLNVFSLKRTDLQRVLGDTSRKKGKTGFD